MCSVQCVTYLSGRSYVSGRSYGLVVFLHSVTVPNFVAHPSQKRALSRRLQPKMVRTRLAVAFQLFPIHTTLRGLVVLLFRN